MAAEASCATEIVLGRETQRPVIVAGHYCVAEALSDLSSDGECEQRSFELGVRTYARARASGQSPALVLWINDIGISPEARNILKKEFAIPKNYRHAMSSCGVSAEEINVLFESTIRNKGSTNIRSLESKLADIVRRVPRASKGLVRCVDDEVCALSEAEESLVIRGPRGEDLVIKDGPHPKCCLILATLFAHLTTRLRADCIVNVFNNLYTARIEYGVHVARVVYRNSVPIVNMFISEENVYGPYRLSAALQSEAA